MTTSRKRCKGGTMPAYKKPSKATSYRMKRIRSKGTKLENAMEEILKSLGLTYEKQPKLLGHPDFRIKNTRILIFCDSSFWHGRNPEKFTKNRKFWEAKISKNRLRDAKTSRALRKAGWIVLRFWDDEVLRNQARTADSINAVLGTQNPRPNAIDLFCGAGGLSLGLERAGFKVLAGVEINPKIAKTYAVNHPDAKLLIKDIRNVTGEELLRSAGVKKITLLAGCPPCQGFSALTSKYRKEDSRNGLVLEMARLIEEIRPKMVMMENVPGLAKRGKPILDEFIKRLEESGYNINKAVLQLADYGVPQSRRRFVLLAGRGFDIPIPKPTHSCKGRNGLKPWLALSDVIGKMSRPVTLSKAIAAGGPEKFNWHVVRDLTKLSIDRLQALKAGSSRFSLPLRLRPKCHAEDRGFQNVYGKLDWKQTPPTITSGCTTPCMGRFGYPDETRTISIREAALIQTFPRNYRFETDFMDVACDLVGNALPPKFAKLLATNCITALTKKRGE
jgi:DNA (cytosine-5)-methyltransferase 1